MCYPDNTDHIIGTDNRILGYKVPVTGNDYVKGIDTDLTEYLLDGSRALLKNPLVPISKDKFHALTDRFVGRFLKHPAVDTGNSGEFPEKFRKRQDAIEFIRRLNTYKYGSVQ